MLEIPQSAKSEGESDHLLQILENLRGFAQRIARGAGGKGPRQKTSKSVKKFFDTFRKIFAQGKKRQKSSQSVKRFFDTFRRFSRGTSFLAPFGGLWFTHSGDSRDSCSERPPFPFDVCPLGPVWCLAISKWNTSCDAILADWKWCVPKCRVSAWVWWALAVRAAWDGLDSFHPSSGSDCQLLGLIGGISRMCWDSFGCYQDPV